MIRIMFVCHGNICRSPMAEFILRDMLRVRGLEECFFVSSSATSTEEIWGGRGNPVYSPARRELQRHGICPGDKTAVQLRREDYGKYDWFIGMDDANIRGMHRILGGDPEGKTRKLMSYTPRGGDVSDPWYSGDFATAYKDIHEGCEALLASLLGEDKK